MGLHNPLFKLVTEFFCQKMISAYMIIYEMRLICILNIDYLCSLNYIKPPLYDLMSFHSVVAVSSSHSSIYLI